MDDQTTSKNKKILGLASVFAVLFLILIAGIAFSQGKGMNAKEGTNTEMVSNMDGSQNTINSASQSATNAPTTGFMGLKIKGDKKVFAKNDPVVIIVYGNSYNQNVAGFDAAIHYDENILTYSEAKVLLPEMDDYTTNIKLEDGTPELIVSGVKKTSAKDHIVLQDTALIEITFVAKEAGIAPVTLALEKDSAKESNMFNETVQEILSHVGDVKVEVK